MSSSVIGPIAEAIGALTAEMNVSGVTIKPVWPPRLTLPAVPCLEVEMPRLGKRTVDEPQTQLGSEDWDLEYTCHLWFDLRDAVKAQERVIDALEQFEQATRDNPSLGGLAQDLRLTDADPVFDISDSSRTLVGYEMKVQVWTFVAT